MMNSTHPVAAICGTHQIQSFTFAALLAMLLCTLALPLEAQESAAGPPVAAMVNINTANADDLAAGLTGVGPARAEDIIRYREAYGPFTTVEQLTEVKGVGLSTLEKNRARITLE